MRPEPGDLEHLIEDEAHVAQRSFVISHAGESSIVPIAGRGPAATKWRHERRAAAESTPPTFRTCSVTS
ncbi:hypothetical protein FA326_09755 [Pseudomonas aeruginosa]|nr:hypothetical protein [Pseudomonas aeruginosa]